jgi:hypothetical protein
MQSIHILDIKPFMQLLFQTEQLNEYEFVSADIRTDMTYSLDGHINRSFFSEEELIQHSLTQRSYLTWSIAREKVFTLIKGKRTPSLLKIVLRASVPETENLISSTNSSLNSNDIDGIFLNIIFQENKLNVICGISYKIFTMDKELESEFSAKIITLLKSNSITCEI